MRNTEIFTKVSVLNQQISSTPFIVEKRDTGHYITLVTDSSYKIYDCSKLNVIFSGPLISGIKFVYGTNDIVFVVCSFNDYKKSFKVEEHQYSDVLLLAYRSDIIYTQFLGVTVRQMIGFGCFVLLLVDNDGKSQIVVNEICFDTRRFTFLKTLMFDERISTIFHPSTYVNKIVIGYENGNLSVYNIVKEKNVFTTDSMNLGKSEYKNYDRKEFGSNYNKESKLYNDCNNENLNDINNKNGIGIINDNNISIRSDIKHDIKNDTSNKFDFNNNIDFNNKLNTIESNKNTTTNNNNNDFNNNTITNNINNDMNNKFDIIKSDNNTFTNNKFDIIKSDNYSFINNNDMNNKFDIIKSDNNTFTNNKDFNNNIENKYTNDIKNHNDDVIGKIKIIRQSAVLDVVALVIEENKTSKNSIILYNLKKNKVLFTIKEKNVIKSLSFKTDSDPYFIYLTQNGWLTLVNIEEQRIIKRYKSFSALNAEFLFGENLLALTTENSIKLYEIVNLEFKLLKFRRVMNDNIKCIKFITENDFVLVGDNEIYSINIYREEKNNLFSIKDYSNGNNLCISEITGKALVCSQNNIYLLNHQNKNGKKIMESYKKSFKVCQITKCGNFCILATNNKMIKIFNTDSGLFYDEYDFKNEKSDILNVFWDVINDLIIVCLEKKIITINQKNKKREEIEFDEKSKNCEMFMNFIVAKFENEIKFYDIENKKVSRMFKFKEKITTYCISKDTKMIAIANENNEIKIYDIINYGLVDTIANCKSKNIVFSPNMHFLCCAENKSISLYFNKTIFDPKIIYEKTFIKTEKKIEEKFEKIKINILDEIKNGNYKIIHEGNLLNNLTEIGKTYLDKIINEIETKEAVKILNSLKKFLKENFDRCESIVSKILMVHGKNIDYKDIEEFSLLFKSLWIEKEDNLIRTLGYIEYEKREIIDY